MCNRKKYYSFYYLITSKKKGKASKSIDVICQLSESQQVYDYFTLEIYDLDSYGLPYREDPWEIDCNNCEICPFGSNYIMAKIKGNLITEVIKTGDDGTDNMKQFISRLKETWEGLTVRDALEIFRFVALMEDISY